MLNSLGLSVPLKHHQSLPWPYYLSPNMSNCDHILALKASTPAMSPDCWKSTLTNLLFPPLGGERRNLCLSLVSHIAYKAGPKIKTSQHLSSDTIACFRVRKGGVWADAAFTSLVWKSHVYTMTCFDYSFRLSLAGCLCPHNIIAQICKVVVFIIAQICNCISPEAVITQPTER